MNRREARSIAAGIASRLLSAGTELAVQGLLDERQRWAVRHELRALELRMAGRQRRLARKRGRR